MPYVDDNSLFIDVIEGLIEKVRRSRQESESFADMFHMLFCHRFTLAKPFIDLGIVITGVTVAFLLNSLHESRKEEAEQEKVINSLYQELQEIQKFFPSMAAYQQNNNRIWDSLLIQKSVGDFNEYYFIQPQYNYTVIEFAMETRNSDIVDFALHQQLLLLYKRIKMLGQTETYMTTVALQFQAHESESNTNTAHNLFLFKRFIGFGKNRALTLMDVDRLAEQTVSLLKQNSYVQ